MRATTVLFLATIAARGVAQTSTAASPPSDSARSRSVVTGHPEIGRNTTWMMAGALGAGIAVSLFDSRLLTDTRRLGNHTAMDRGSAIGNAIGGPGPIALGLALYAGGRVTGDDFVTTTGREVMRAVLVSGGLTAMIKGAVGRSRPFASPGDADEYDPGHGFLNSARGSFPSGHTSAAFAAATVLVREMNRTHPRTRLILDPLLLSGATFVGFSRVYDQQHWPSDVVVGAALGAITGYEVVAHAHGDRSRINLGFLSHLMLGRRDHEMELGWSIR